MRQNGRGAFAYGDNRTESRTQEPMQKGRVLLLAVRIFLLVLLQVSVVSRIGFFGATPDVILAYLAVRTVTERGMRRWRRISLSGLFVGFLADAIGGVGVGLSTLFYFLVGAICPTLLRRGARNLFEGLLLSYALLLPVAVLKAGVTLLTVLLSDPSGFSFVICLTETLLPEFVGTLIFALPIFLIFRARR